MDTMPAATMEMAMVRQALGEDREVLDCEVLERRDVAGNRVRIAYVATSGRVDGRAVRKRLESRIDAALLPDYVVDVTGIAVDEDGRIDVQALQRLPVIGAAETAAFADALGSIYQVRSIDAQLVDSEAPAETATSTAEPVYAQYSTGDDQDDREAMCEGPPLVFEPCEKPTLIAALLQTVQQYPDRGTTHVREDGSAERHSFAQLLNDASRILSGLRSAGVQENDYVVLQCSSTKEHLCAFWACVLGGFIPVTVAVPRSYTTDCAVFAKLCDAVRVLNCRVALCGDSVLEAMAAALLDDALRQLRILSVRAMTANRPAEEFARRNPQDVLFCQLSSGSTGVSKCIRITHLGVASQVAGARRLNSYCSDDRSLNWLPVDHVVPVLTCHLKNVYLGIEEVVVATDYVLEDPARWLLLMAEHRITHSWSPNFGFKLAADRIVQRPSPGLDLSCVKQLMNAGEQVTLAVIRSFIDACARYGLSRQAMQPAFGMAETCTCITFRSGFDAATAGHVHRLSANRVRTAASPGHQTLFVDVGPPIAGVRLRICRDDGSLARVGEPGRLQVAGAVVTPGYINNEEANREAFVGDWLDTGDLGFIRNSSLTITGRRKEAISILGTTYYCHDIEDSVQCDAGVLSTYVAAVGVEDKATGSEGVVIFFVPVAGVDVRLTVARITGIVARNFGTMPLAVMPLAKEAFPKTTSGKIQRASLKGRFLAERLAQPAAPVRIDDPMQDWIFQRRWRRDERAASPASDHRRTALVLIRDCDSGRQLLARLHRVFDEVLPVIDEPLGRLDGQHDFRTLFAGRIVSDVICAWDYVGDEEGIVAASIEAHALRLLSLFQALARTWNGVRGRRLICIATGSQAVDPSESAAPRSAAAITLLRAMRQEYPDLTTVHIDLTGEPLEQADACIARELHGCSAEVAYRRGLRFTPSLQRYCLARPSKQAAIKTGGFYVVAGGRGAIGTELTRLLVERFDASVLVIGRSAAMPDSMQFDDSRVMYAVADVADESAVLAAFATGMRRFGRAPDGAFNLAGLLVERPIAEESPATLIDTLRPKLHGTESLAIAMQRHQPEGLLVCFSSVAVFFGGAGAGVYALANHLMEVYLRRLANSRLERRCIAWSAWAGLGMSREQVDLRRMGFRSISASRGMEALLALLGQPPADVLVGLDGAQANVGRYLGTSQSAARLIVKVAAGPTAPADALPQWIDRFGTIVPYKIVAAASAEGVQVGCSHDEEGTLRDSASANDICRGVVQLVSELSRISCDALDIKASLYEYGIDSLTSMKLINRIDAVFGVAVKRKDLFRAGTVSALARLIANLQQERATLVL